MGNIILTHELVGDFTFTNVLVGDIIFANVLVVALVACVCVALLPDHSDKDGLLLPDLLNRETGDSAGDCVGEVLLPDYCCILLYLRCYCGGGVFLPDHLDVSFNINGCCGGDVFLPDYYVSFLNTRRNSCLPGSVARQLSSCFWFGG